MTGNILLPPFSSKLYVPNIAKNLLGSIFSYIDIFKIYLRNKYLID
jgi:hypothetical protein